MGKRSKRPGRASRDIHAAILADAATLNASERFGIRSAADFPELAELLEACRAAVAASVPRYVTFKGRTYWLRVRLAVQLDVFAKPGDAHPLVRGASLSTQEFGHAPGH